MRDLIRIARLSNQYKNFMTKDTDIKGKYCKFIMFLNHHEGMTQDEIASSMSMDKSNAARQLSDMEKDGFIERRVKPEDKRNLLIFPTKKAKDAYPFVKELLISWDDYVMEDLTEEEKKVYYSIIKKMKDRANSWREHDFSAVSYKEETDI